MAEQFASSERFLAQVLGEYFQEAHMEATYRAQLLSSGMHASLVAGICATLVLAIIFTVEFFGLRYAYGAGLLFVVALVVLLVLLLRMRIFQAIKMGESV